MMQADPASRASIPAASQLSLSPSQRQQGLFLACCAYPCAAICAALPEATINPTTQGTISAIAPLNKDVLQLFVSARLNYEPGQFANLRVSSQSLGEIQRSFSMASAPTQEQTIEFHIKQRVDGKFSYWLKHEAKVGDEITLTGPHGMCQLNFDDLNSNSIVLAGTSTGLAPLFAILETLINQNYAGEIHLLLANRSVNDFYHVAQLQTLAQSNANLTVHFLTQEESAAAPFVSGDVYQHIKNLPVDLSRSSVFLCGAESFVQKMRKVCFLQGAAMKRIKADAFLAS